ncbi:CBS domain-containing protein [Thalassomonas viridans]|uniref:CBS domain-containing protein n=1 Tax=Thalassomonas viridans TaxID=137584 RepID=A0AAE9YYZ8_9GAMM|nr:CBS domain-containing protein [Thalassomonas viridans]WDE03791.1 CBS domain-containing protein [Thalassomonas viridans]
MTTLLVKDFLTPDVVKLDEQTSLSQAIDLIQDAKVISLPVVNGQNELTGFVSEQDLLKPLLEGSYYCDGAVKVADFMQTDVVTVTPNMNIFDIAQSMNSQRPKSYPVVEGGKFVGMLYRRDVLSALNQHYQSCQPA